MCRCYQAQTTSPISRMASSLPGVSPQGSPPSYLGSMPYGENQTVPQSSLHYPSYPGYAPSYDAYGMMQSIYPQMSPVCAYNNYFLWKMFILIVFWRSVVRMLSTGIHSTYLTCLFISYLYFNTLLIIMWYWIFSL